MNVYLAKLMMYYEIHRMYREGHSVLAISDYLVSNRRTVKKYLSMTEQEYENFLLKQSDRKKSLVAYEDFVRVRLESFPDTSAAQMHDWLKEHHPEFERVNQKTVFNFVCWIRKKYNLPRIKPVRQYQMVEECAYGKQAQVDFGEYNLRSSDGKRAKVFFFTLVLSRSRFKYVWFIDRYFTSALAIEAHEQAFNYLQGVPAEIVYDQDKVFIVNENGGDIILTDGFRAYTREQSFALLFCRKADPESKGKIENVVKYVKQNFLYNRTYHNLDTLNDEAMAWLGRTANALPHAFTSKEPYAEWAIEKSFLTPYVACLKQKIQLPTYSVRKDNSISYKGNLYSLPLGTYKGPGTLVSVAVEDNELHISAAELQLCKHKIIEGKGIKILNSDHKRDKSSLIHEMIEQICLLFTQAQQAREWLYVLKRAKPRYIRDQLLIIKSAIESTAPELVEEALQYCLSNKINSAADFKSIIAHYQQREEKTRQESGARIIQLNPLNGIVSEDAFKQPEKSSMAAYESLLKKK